MSPREQILNLMRELGIEAKKSLGQNFLISSSVIEKILLAAERLRPGSIVEVGPGLGSLTRGLMKLNRPLQLLELDRQLAEYWRGQNLPVIEGDALHWDWNLQNLPQLQEPIILVSNLPYQISKSIVVDRCLDAKPVSAMILMFQKEVAQKIKAQCGSEHYGMMSVLPQIFWDIDLVCEASSGDFMPAPKVASRVLKFIAKPSPVQDRAAILRLLKACFLHPRKMMISNLVTALGRSKEQLLGIFAALRISEKTRAEELMVEQFLELYFALGYK